MVPIFTERFAYLLLIHPYCPIYYQIFSACRSSCNTGNIPYLLLILLLLSPVGEIFTLPHRIDMFTHIAYISVNIYFQKSEMCLCFQILRTLSDTHNSYLLHGIARLFRVVMYYISPIPAIML